MRAQRVMESSERVAKVYNVQGGGRVNFFSVLSPPGRSACLSVCLCLRPVRLFVCLCLRPVRLSVCLCLRPAGLFVHVSPPGRSVYPTSDARCTDPAVAAAQTPPCGTVRSIYTGDRGTGPPVWSLSAVKGTGDWRHSNWWRHKHETKHTRKKRRGRARGIRVMLPKNIIISIIYELFFRPSSSSCLV